MDSYLCRFPVCKHRGARFPRAREVKFQTVSQKRFEITLSIWYANSSGAQALSIGKGYGAVRGRISEKLDQNLILALELQKWLETIVPIL